MFDVLMKAAHAGGQVLLHYFEQELSLTQKGSHHNVVTIADITAQKKIQESLVDGFIKLGHPRESVGFIGEENLHEEKEYTFIIDPLDGTSNFTSGLDLFCVSIAVYRKRMPVAGLIYVPTSGVVYYAESGKGAFKEVKGMRTPLHIKPTDHNTSLLLTNISSSSAIRTEILALCNRAMKHFKNIRALGAAALDLALLSDNRASVVVYGKTSVWDIAAGIIIVREAGGEVYDWTGTKVELDFEQRDTVYRFAAMCSGKWPQVATWIQ